MADTAASLVDYVLPQVGVRQWVLSLPFPAPSDDDVRTVLADAAQRIGRQLAARDEEEPHNSDEAVDPLAAKNPVLASVYAASVQSRVPAGPRKGQSTDRQAASGWKAPGQKTSSRLCAVGHGLSLHAGVYVPGADRERLEHLCRYTARPPLATERLRELPDGRLRYELRHPFCANNGETERRISYWSDPS